MKLRLKKGDSVLVISGNDKGTVGRVMQVYPKTMRILVEGVSLRKKHQRPTQNNPKGGIVSKEMPIHYSNVMIVDSGKSRSRIGIRFEEKGGKVTPVRYAKTNDEEL